MKQTVHLGEIMAAKTIHYFASEFTKKFAIAARVGVSPTDGFDFTKPRIALCHPKKGTETYVIEIFGEPYDTPWVKGDAMVEEHTPYVVNELDKFFHHALLGMAQFVDEFRAATSAMETKDEAAVE